MHSKKYFSVIAIAFGAMAMLLSTSAVFAANKYWGGGNDNVFTGTGNWVTSGSVVTPPPTTEDNAYVSDTYYGTNPSPVFASGSMAVGALTLGMSAGGGQLEITGSAYLEAGSVNVGRSTGWGGRLILSGNAAMNTAGSSFQIGSENVGVVDMSEDSSIFTTTSVRVGVTGTATGTLSLRDNASFTTRSYIRVGGVSGTGGEGTILMSGSSRLIAGYESATQYLTIGHTGTGTLIIEDDAIIEAPIVYIGKETTGTGTVHLKGGFIATANIARGDGVATLDINGGGVRAIADIGDFFGGFPELTINATGVAADKSAFTVDTAGHELIMSTTFAYNGADDGIALDKVGDGTLILYAQNTINGIVRVSKGTLMSGSHNILSQARLSVASGATFDMGAFNQSFKGVENNGEIYFSTNKDTVGRKLTINGNLSGKGTFFMSVSLGTEVADTIAVTGVATGTHTLKLKNLGGAMSPDLTLDILTLGAGSTAVIRSNDVDGRMGTYFLNPEVDPVTGEIVYGLSATGNNSIAADAIISTAASLGTEWHYSLDSMRSRFGEIRALPKPESALTSTWYQGSAYRLETQMELTTVPYDQDTYGGTFGVDRIIPCAESRVLLGAFVSINRSDRTYDILGDGNTIDHGGGVYLTWLHDAGWFADFVIKGNQYKSSFAVTSNDDLHTTADYNTWGAGFSVEFGRKFSFGRRFWVEPSVQMATAWFNGGDYTTNTDMYVEIDRSNATQYRGQVALGWRLGTRWYPYAKAGIVRSDAGGGLVHVDKQSWQTQYAGWRFEAGAGIAVTIADHSLLYLGYEYNKADLYTRPWAVNLGYRRTW